MKKCAVCGRECKQLVKCMCTKHYNQFMKYGKVLDNNPRTRFDNNEIIEYEDYAEIVLYNKDCEEVARALIDLEDIDKVKNKKWCIKDNGYICTRKTNTYIHRLIMNCSDDAVIDHINHNTLDNRKENLRVCTHQQNMMNKHKQLNNTSGCIGVSWDKKKNKWYAYININRKRTFLGYFSTKEEAIEARKQAELEYFGEYRNKEDEE